MLFWLFATGISIEAKAVTSESGEYRYSILSDGTICLTGYELTGLEAVIPTEVDGYTVSSIDCFYATSKLKKVTIPACVKRIEDKCFYECNNLQSVSFLGDGLEYIGEYAFFNCNLQSFSFPSTVKEVGRVAFGYADFADITIPKSVTKWGDSIFYSSKGIKNVIFEEGATIVPESMFSGCDNLTTVTLPNTITTISKSAFSHGGKISEMNIPASVTTIEGWAFYYIDFAKLTVESNTFTVGECAFEGCDIDNLYCPKNSTIYNLYKEDENTNITLIGTYLQKDSLEVRVGNTVQAKVVNPKGETTWSSSNPQIATVSSQGVITGKKKGTAVITAINNGVTMNCKVTVKNISLNKTKATVTVGYTTKLKLDGAKSKVKWKSSNKSVATVTSKGVVKGKKIGKTTISAKYKGKTYKCKVTVKANEKNVGVTYSTSPSTYPLNKCALGFYKIKRDSAGNYVLYGHVINNYPQTMESVSQLAVVVYCNDKKIAEQTYDRFYVTVSPRTCKKITVTINKKNVKKADLRAGDITIGFKSAGVYLYK